MMVTINTSNPIARTNDAKSVLAVELATITSTTVAIIALIPSEGNLPSLTNPASNAITPDARKGISGLFVMSCPDLTGWG